MDWVARIEALRRQLLLLLEAHVLPEKSYLAGGTAIYLYLTHRISIDLDFFTPERFNVHSFTYDLKQALKGVAVELAERDTVIAFFAEQRIKVSLFFLPYRLLSDVVGIPVRHAFCPCAGLPDIAAMKALAISQRGAARDFVDLFFLLQHTGYTFADIAAFVQKKYDLPRNYEYQLKTSFAYFDDAEREADSILLLQNDTTVHALTDKEWASIKDYFVRLAS